MRAVAAAVFMHRLLPYMELVERAAAATAAIPMAVALAAQVPRTRVAAAAALVITRDPAETVVLVLSFSLFPRSITVEPQPARPQSPPQAPTPSSSSQLQALIQPNIKERK